MCIKKINSNYNNTCHGRAPFLQQQELNKPLTNTKLINTSKNHDNIGFLYKNVSSQQCSIDLCKIMAKLFWKRFKFLYISDHDKTIKDSAVTTNFHIRLIL